MAWASTNAVVTTFFAAVPLPPSGAAGTPVATALPAPVAAAPATALAGDTGAAEEPPAPDPPPLPPPLPDDPLPLYATTGMVSAEVYVTMHEQPLLSSVHLQTSGVHMQSFLPSISQH